MTSLADVLVSDDELPGNLEATRTSLREAVTDSTTANDPTNQSATAAATTATTDDVPEKFRGKSAKEVVEMYQNLESRLGTMANDLGAQRQLTDRLLDLTRKRDTDLQRNTPPAERKPALAPVTANDILDKPQETVERVVDARVSTVTEDVNTRLARAEAALAQTAFTLHHPDYTSVVNDPEFGEWVKGSAIRMRAAAAANQGNWQIADELLTDFKAGLRKPAASADGAAGNKQPSVDLEGARRATLETTGSAGGKTDGKSGEGKKTYRRADLMRLRISDPEAYYDESFQNEILKAHSEGRVR